MGSQRKGDLGPRLWRCHLGSQGSHQLAYPEVQAAPVWPWKLEARSWDHEHPSALPHFPLPMSPPPPLGCGHRSSFGCTIKGA